jgi:uncharacterized membrane protein YgaE (UPF0421/DUF939 family)
MISKNGIFEASIWILFVLVCLSGSAIIAHLIPTFPVLLVFVFLLETILVVNMMISIRRIKRSIEPGMRHKSRERDLVDLVDIENGG